jgi:MFS family permease
VLKSLVTAKTLASFRRPGFPFLWLAISLSGFATAATQVSIGWLALELTGSPLAVGIAVASRTIPRFFLAVPWGAFSDRRDRRRLLQLTFLFGAIVAGGAAATSVTGMLGFLVLVCVALLLGVTDVTLTTTDKAFCYDVVGPDEAVNGIALETLGDKAFGVMGALSAGALLEVWGAGAAFSAIGAAYFLGVLALAGIRRTGRSSRVDDEAEGPVFKNLFLIWRNRNVIVLATVVAAAEILAFSSDVVLPSFARDVLQVGESGLGTMYAVRNAGSVIGLLVLASISRQLYRGPLVLWLGAIFGLGLIAFSAAPTYLIALLLMGVIGAIWASVDSLLPALLQYGVRDDERGAAVGVWNFSRGLGPLGHLEIGALAAALGAPLALGINGAILFLIMGSFTLLYRARRFGWSK